MKLTHNELLMLANALTLAIQSNNEASKLTISEAVTEEIGRSTEELSALHRKICGMFTADKQAVWIVADDHLKSRLLFGVSHYTDYAEYYTKRAQEETPGSPIRQSHLDASSFNRGRARGHQEILEFIMEEDKK